MQTSHQSNVLTYNTINFTRPASGPPIHRTNMFPFQPNSSKHHASIPTIPAFQPPDSTLETRRVQPLTNPRPLRQLMHTLPIPPHLLIKNTILIPRQHLPLSRHIRLPPRQQFHRSSFRSRVSKEFAIGQEFSLSGSAAVTACFESYDGGLESV